MCVRAVLQMHCIGAPNSCHEQVILQWLHAAPGTGRCGSLSTAVALSLQSFNSARGPQRHCPCRSLHLISHQGP